MAKTSTGNRDLILGLLFFGGLIALGWITTQLRHWPGKGARSYLHVLFEDVNGVRQEDLVQVHGTRYGRVIQLLPIPRATWDATGRDLAAEGLVPAGQDFQPNVLMVLEIEHPLELRGGYHVHADDATLLGGKVVTIEPGPLEAAPIDVGRTDEPLAELLDAAPLADVRLIGRPRPHSIAAIGELVQDNRGKLDEIVENLRVASQGLQEDKAKQGILGFLLTDTAGREKVETAVDALAKLADQSGQEDNLIHDVFYPSKLRDDLASAMDRLREMADESKDPNSLIGSLFQAGSPLKQDIDAAASGIREFVDKANQEDSLVGKLVSTAPDSLGSRVDRVVDNIDRLAQAGNTNTDSFVYQAFHGDLGTVMRNTFTRIDSELSRFSSSIIDPIQRGDGVAGMLINDPDARKKLERLLDVTLGILEDAREAAPVTSLGSFIFGGF